MAVISHFKAMIFDDASLDFFESRAIEFNNSFATQTDQVIMMSLIQLKLCISVRKLALDGNARLNQQFQSAKNRGWIYVPSLPSEMIVNLLHVVMPVQSEKFARNHLALRS